VNGHKDHTIRGDIKKRLYELIEVFVDQPLEFAVEGEVRRMLHIILSESMQAMEFVIALEEEFEIEFDDEDISIEFFLDLDHIVLSVLRGLDQKDSE